MEPMVLKHLSMKIYRAVKVEVHIASCIDIESGYNAGVFLPNRCLWLL